MVPPRALVLAFAAVWGVRIAADAVRDGALALRLDAVVHGGLDLLAIALLFEARGVVNFSF